MTKRSKKRREGSEAETKWRKEEEGKESDKEGDEEGDKYKKH